MSFNKDIPFIALDKNFNILSVPDETHRMFSDIFKSDYFKNLLCVYNREDFDEPVFINAPRAKGLNFGFLVMRENETIKCFIVKNDKRQAVEKKNLISYRMREPISSIFALLPIIVDSVNNDKPDKAISHLEEIYSKSYKLLRNVTNISLADKISDGELSGASAIDFSSLLNSIILSVKTVVKDINITGDIEDGVIISANPVLMTNGILNLFSNSISYRTDRPVEITVKLSVQENKAVFGYRDNSKGIKPEYQSMVFSPYFSKDPYGDAGADRELGLGLYIVKNAFRTAGGNILLTSDFGEGVKYTVSMPLCGDCEVILESSSTDFLLNRFSEVFVQLCSRCNLPLL